MDLEEVATTCCGGSEYVQLQSSIVEDGTSLSLTIWPNLIGEKAHYSFIFVPTYDITADNEIWIQFDNNYYDYFVAETLSDPNFNAMDEDFDQFY